MNFRFSEDKLLWVPELLDSDEYLKIKYSFSLPLLVENQNYPDYPYTLLGSCFMISRNGIEYVVTAKHCLEGNGGKADHLFVLKNLKARECVGLTNAYIPKEIIYEGQVLSDKNQLDFLIFKVEKNNFTDIYPFVLDDNFRIQPISGAPVFNLSYPFLSNKIEYDQNKIFITQRYFTGSYLNKEDDFTHRVRLKVNGESLQGASGSPLMIGSKEDFKIAGIMTRADENTFQGEAAFIEILLVQLAIDQMQLTDKNEKSA